VKKGAHSGSGFPGGAKDLGCPQTFLKTAGRNSKNILKSANLIDELCKTCSSLYRKWLNQAIIFSF